MPCAPRKDPRWYIAKELTSDAEHGAVVKTGSFRLQKWYLDAADERGNVYIGYWGKVNWKHLRLVFFQHLWHTEQGGVRTRSGLSKRPPPRMINENLLRWDTAEARVGWQSAADEGISETLLTTSEGDIDWQCLQPKARATVVSDEVSFSGWGYTERLDISIPPWRLPINTLYWGRCHSEHHYLVWIKWDGPTQQSLLWHDGVRTAQVEISEQGISVPGVALVLDECSTLRQGVLRTTIGKSLGRIAALFPRRTFMLDEHKSYARGRLASGDSSELATAIYERVQW